MATDERRDREKNINLQKKSGSDRNRIKNITNEVHPEYAAQSKRQGALNRETSQNAQLSEKRTKQNARKAMQNAQSQSRKETAEQLERERRRRKSAERRKKIRRRRRIQSALRFFAACLVVAALVTTVWVVKNYNSGSRHDARGITAYENGNYQSAVSEFKEALSYDGQNADYYIHLGMAYIELKAYDEALGYFKQAEDCADKDTQKALLNRGRGIACLYQGDYTAAISWFADAVEADGKDQDMKTDTLYYKAEAEEKAGAYKEAVQSYGQIISMKDDAGARMLRGMAYMALEDYAAAETDLQAAVNQSRKSYSIYRALYSAMMAQGKEEEALDVLNDALKLAGSSGEDYFNRGMIYIDLQDNESAVEMLQKSYEKGYKAALLGLGETAIDQQDYQQALEYYETFFNEADLADMDGAILAKGYNQYAICLMAVGNYEKAAEICENGLKYNDRTADAELSFNLIASYEKLGRWEDAYNLAKDYVSKYPDDAKGVKEYQFLESRVTQ